MVNKNLWHKGTNFLRGKMDENKIQTLYSNQGRKGRKRTVIWPPLMQKQTYLPLIRRTDYGEKVDEENSNLSSNVKPNSVSASNSCRRCSNAKVLVKFCFAYELFFFWFASLTRQKTNIKFLGKAKFCFVQLHTHTPKHRLDEIYSHCLRIPFILSTVAHQEETLIGNAHK